MYIKFDDSNNMVECEVSVSGNVATLKFKDSVIVDTSGFHVYLDAAGDYDIGGKSYERFITIYRNDEETAKYNGYQLSNDGSTYVEPVEPEPIPEPEPEPPEPTLEEVKAQKVAEMNQVQQSIIQNGVEVTLSDGTTERFTLKDQDQLSLMGLRTLAEQGVDKIPWHDADNAEHCKYYSAEDMSRITGAALSFISYEVTYFRDLRIYINSMEDKESVQSVIYGMYIPVEYQSEVLADYYSAENV